MVSDIVQSIDALSIKDMLLPLIVIGILLFCLGYALRPRSKPTEKPKDDTVLELDSPDSPLSIDSLVAENADLENQLKEAQLQIDAQEKLASVGILSAGIAHEIKNPLNFINNFADTTIEIIAEHKELLSKALKNVDPTMRDDLLSAADEIADNCLKMQTHGKRAESIIKNMLIQARSSVVEKEPVDINALLEEFVNLAYHGMRAQDSNFNAKIEKNLDTTIPKVTVSPQSLGRVFLNLINNALYAINEKAQLLKKEDPSSTFMPTISIKTEQTPEEVIISIRDNGEGMPEDIQAKIFERFFTTKPAGHGTGLGLPICYDIVVKEHKGKLSVTSTQHEFTDFTIQLPKTT